MLIYGWRDWLRPAGEGMIYRWVPVLEQLELFVGSQESLPVVGGMHPPRLTWGCGELDLTG